MIGAALLAIAAVAAEPPELARAAAEWDRAQVQGNARAIGRLLAEDYVLVSGSGKLESRAQFQAELTDPAYRLEPFTVEQPLIRVWADGAVLGGVVRERGRDHGQSFDARIRFADVWAKRRGRWVLVYTHVSRP